MLEVAACAAGRSRMCAGYELHARRRGVAALPPTTCSTACASPSACATVTRKERALQSMYRGASSRADRSLILEFSPPHCALAQPTVRRVFFPVHSLLWDVSWSETRRLIGISRSRSGCIRIRLHAEVDDGGGRLRAVSLSQLERRSRGPASRLQALTPGEVLGTAAGALRCTRPGRASDCCSGR